MLTRKNRRQGFIEQTPGLLDSQKNHAAHPDRRDVKDCLRDIVRARNAASCRDGHLRFARFKRRDDTPANHTANTVNRAATPFWASGMDAIEDFPE